MCLPFLVPFNELINSEDKQDKKFTIEYSNYFIHYNYQWDGHYFGPIYKGRTQEKPIDSAKADVNIIEMISDTYKRYLQIPKP